MKEKKYLFKSEEKYKKFIKELDNKIEYLEKKATPNFLVVPSYACNLHCIYCYEQTYMIKGTTDINPIEMVNLQFDRIDKIMEIYENKYGTPEDNIRITIMGGEPLLRCNLKTVSYIDNIIPRNCVPVKSVCTVTPNKYPMPLARDIYSLQL